MEYSRQAKRVPVLLVVFYIRGYGHITYCSIKKIRYSEVHSQIKKTYAGGGGSWPPMMSLCQYYLSTAENSNGSGEEARGHASDVWREGRRGRGTETRHRQLEK